MPSPFIAPSNPARMPMIQADLLVKPGTPEKIDRLLLEIVLGGMHPRDSQEQWGARITAMATELMAKLYR